MQSSVWGGTTPAPAQAGGHPSGKQFSREGPGGPVGHQAEQEQHCALATKKVRAVLGCIRQRNASWWRHVVLPL